MRLKKFSIPVIVMIALVSLSTYTTSSFLKANAKTIVTATRDDNMAMGNPSKATTDVKDKNNYLMVKPVYTLSYNNSKGMANWVSWHLSTAWLGEADRCNCFTMDDDLPAGYVQVRTTNYTGCGFDRGHLCPSADRSGNEEENRASFLMTNMAPQSPILNEQIWKQFEDYCRKLVAQGNELYIVAGSYGTHGEGKKGFADTIGAGKITVPAHFWKIVVVLPVGTNDVKRVTKDTRVIALYMPNRQSVNAYDWSHYRTTVDALEVATGYDFLSAVPVTVQKVIEAAKDTGAIN